MKLFLSFIGLFLLVSCSDHDTGKIEEEGGESHAVITLKQIEWKNSERTDSICFTYGSNLTGHVGTLQKYYEGSELVSKIRITNQSGYIAYIAKFESNSWVDPIYGIRQFDQSDTNRLLLFSRETPTIPDTLFITNILSRAYISEIHYQSGGTDQFEYDDQGNLLQSTRRDGLVTTYTYDDKHGFWRLGDSFFWLYPAIDGARSFNANTTNNVLTEARTDQEGNTINISYSYTYNEYDLPVTMKIISDEKIEQEYKINYDIKKYY